MELIYLKKLNYVLLYIFSLLIKCSAGDDDLLFAHVIFRHGDRMIIDPYPNDPWKSQEYWPNEFGQLTNIGKEQHYELGKWLAKRYSKLIHSTYSKDDIFIRSTDVDRSLMSALSNLAGLFPPNKNDTWNKDINWQPIPVHTVLETDDNVLAAKKNCPAYNYALKKLKKSKEFVALDEKYEHLYQYLTEKSGRKIDSLETVQFLYDCLHIETLYNKTLPEWTKKVYPGDMEWISSKSFAVNAYTPQLARLKSGNLLKEMLDRFTNKTNSNLVPNRSLWVYSAHDTTVANILNTLGMFELHNPPYRACIMLELRIKNSIPYVSIFYKNTTSEPSIMTIKNCGTKCPLDRMYEIYDDVLPKDWESECRLNIMTMTYEDVDIQPTLMMIVSLVMILLLLILLGCITFLKNHHQDSKWYLRIDS